VIEVLSEPFADKTDTMLKHIFFILKDDMHQIIEAAKEVREIDADKIESDSERMVKYVNLFMRSMSKRISDTNDFYWSMVNLMHMMGRQMIRLVDALDGVKPYKLKPEYVEYLEAVEHGLDLLYDGLYKKSFASLQKIHDEQLQYRNTFKKVYSSPKEYETILMTHFRNIYRFIVYSTGAGIGVIASSEQANE
jgi:hypothetical protein